MCGAQDCGSMARAVSGLMSHWGQKSGPSKVSLVMVTLLRGTVLGERWAPELLPSHTLPLISCCGSRTFPTLTHMQAITARVFNDALTLFSLVPWWELPQPYTRLSDSRLC